MQNPLIYIKYLSNSSDFYEKVKPIATEDFNIDIDDNWQVDKGDYWTMYFFKNKPMYTQGFKIHISTEYYSSSRTLDIVSKILISKQIHFKYVRGKELLKSSYSKHADRTSSGKFITIYPAPNEFLSLLNILDTALKNLPRGPYILTDRQYKKGNVYYRYGAFQLIENEKGELCIYNPQGELIPDIRKPAFYLPEFVKLPQELIDIENQDNSKEEIHIENPLQKYKIESALKFSNAGGLYKATKLETGKSYIIKEARYETGILYERKFAQQALEDEYNALLKLKDVKCVVNVEEFFELWEHKFLIEEFVDSTHLGSWLGRNYPFFSQKEEANKYFDKVKTIIEQLKNTILQMHQIGIAHRDLQKENILVDDDLNITIIDFEGASDVDETFENGFVTLGFSHKDNKTARDMDWYALGRLFQTLLIPVSPMLDFDIEVNVEHCLWIYENFGEEAYNYFHQFQIDCNKNISKSKQLFKNTYEKAFEIIKKQNINKQIDCEKEYIYIVDKLKTALLNNMNFSDERLIFGDIRQYEMPTGMFSFQNGGFGTIYALHKLDSLPKEIDSWIKRSLDILKTTKNNNGLLTGLSGIATVLYDCDYKDSSIHMMDMIIDSYIEKNDDDLSLRSGLSGIGLAFIYLYSNTNNYKYKKFAEQLAKKVISDITNNKNINPIDGDAIKLGLIDGYSGISLFISILYFVTRDEFYLNNAISMLEKDLEGTVKNRNDILEVHDTPRGRTLPYLANGSIGIAIAIEVLNKVSDKNLFVEELKDLIKVSKYSICVEPSLFAGMGGFFINNYFDNKIQETLKKIKLFLLEKDDGYVTTGRWAYRLSLDVQTGSTGILLGLLSSKNNNPLYWLPTGAYFWDKIIVNSAKPSHSDLNHSYCRF